jgi:hypothetical protein
MNLNRPLIAKLLSGCAIFYFLVFVERGRALSFRPAKSCVFQFIMNVYGVAGEIVDAL